MTEALRLLLEAQQILMKTKKMLCGTTADICFIISHLENKIQTLKEEIKEKL